MQTISVEEQTIVKQEKQIDKVIYLLKGGADNNGFQKHNKHIMRQQTVLAIKHVCLEVISVIIIITTSLFADNVISNRDGTVISWLEVNLK